MGRRRDSALAAAGFAGLLLLVWAATAGPVGILTASGRTFTFDPAPPRPTATETAGGGKTLEEATRDVVQTRDLAWLGELILWTLLLGLLLGLVLLTRALWRRRPRPGPKPREVAFDVLPEATVGEALRDDVSSQLAAVAEGSPRNGIVGCWLRLEEVVAAAGLPRNPWETSAEFTVRILHALDLDPRAIGALSRLYREARFSEHDLDEAARATAGAALRQLHSDLQELGQQGAGLGSRP